MTPAAKFVERFQRKCRARDGHIIYIGAEPLDLAPRRTGTPGTRVSSWRAAWIIANGPVPEGMDVTRVCGSDCVNVEHMRLMKPGDFGREFGRQSSAKLTPEQVREVRSLRRYARGQILRLALKWEVSLDYLRQLRTPSRRALLWKEVA